MIARYLPPPPPHPRPPPASSEAPDDWLETSMSPHCEVPADWLAVLMPAQTSDYAN